MILVSKIGLGTVQFGLDYGISNQTGQTSISEASRILETAVRLGINLIDTAAAYGNSEEALGNFKLDKFKIVSKFMPPPNSESITDQLNRSLKRLKSDHIYGYLAHRPESIIKNKKNWDELQKVKDTGLITKIGFSFNYVHEIELALKKKMIPDLIQVPYNIFDNRFEQSIIELKSQGCEIHTRSSFLQGLFFMKPEELPPYFNSVKEVLHEIQIFGKDLPSMLLEYCISKSFIDKVIIGVNNERQLVENINTKQNNFIALKSYQFSEDIVVPSNWPKL